MSEKVCKEDIRNALRREYGMSEREASDALNKFFGVIVKALEEERYVKVKGLGIFKLIDVESRRGVDVNTGANIEIPGHRKISFSADAGLKELVNKPFSHFETVVLKENVLLEESVQESEGDKVEMEEVMSLEKEGTSENFQTVGGVKDTMPEVMDKKCEKKERKLQPLMSREDLHKMELLMESERRKNRIAMIVVAILMAFVLFGGLVFMLFPEWVERLFYGF